MKKIGPERAAHPKFYYVDAPLYWVWTDFDKALFVQKKPFTDNFLSIDFVGLFWSENPLVVILEAMRDIIFPVNLAQLIYSSYFLYLLDLTT